MLNNEYPTSSVLQISRLESADASTWLNRVLNLNVFKTPRYGSP